VRRHGETISDCIIRVIIVTQVSFVGAAVW